MTLSFSPFGHLLSVRFWFSLSLGKFYHPHLHLVIPGGAVSEKGDQWVSSRQDLFVHTKPLEHIFGATFKDAMKKAQLFDTIYPDLWNQQWVAYGQAVGKGHNSLRYLSRYVFRVAISNNRIKSISDNAIRFSYKDRQRKTWKSITLEPMEFIQRFLQHVLPKGCIHPVKFPIGTLFNWVKIRYYGFLNPNRSFSIEKLRELISLLHDVITDISTHIAEIKKHVITCPCYGNPLRFIGFLRPVSRWGPSG